MTTWRPRLVSIVMPAYRAEAFLSGALTSVQTQTYRDWELIVVDDHSPDRGAELVERRAREDRRIRLVRMPENGGPSVARRAGIEAAQGRYLAFLDSDDLWAPGKLERQLADLAVTGGGFSFTAYRRISHDGARTGRLIGVPRSLDHRALLRNTAIVTSAVLLDRERIGDVTPRATFHDDFVMWLDLLRKGGRAWGLDEDLVRYRIADGSYSRRKSQMALHVWRTFREVEGMGAVRSAWCFCHYAVRAAWKYTRF